MRWRAHVYPVAIEQVLDIGCLASLTEAEAEEADENGQLAGNHMYQDLRGYTWADLAKAIEIERRLIGRLQAAQDLEAEAEQLDDERLDSFEPDDGLWELDIGVASATVALSALGAVPVGSCNAGGFGGHHQGAHPYVAFFLGKARVDEVVSLAQAAQVGLRSDGAGLAHIYGAGDLDLLRFAETTRDRHGR
jgi:hypothetical protein